MMTVPEPSASQRELDLLRADQRALSHRVDELDTHGTRPVLQLQASFLELVKDVAGLAAAGDRHQQQHDQEIRDRTVGRRWLVGTGLAGLAAMVAMLTLLLQILGRVH